MSTTLEHVDRPGLAGVIFDSLVLAKRGMLRIPRQPDWLFGATVQPLMFLLLFRYIFAGALLIGGGSAVNYLVVGIVVQGVLFGTISTSIGLATDMKEGIIDRFRSLPMSRISVLLGRIICDLVVGIFVTFITIIAGLIIGFRPNASVLEWLQASALMLLLAFSFSWVGAFIGMILKSPEAVMSIGMIWIFPVTFASTSFVEASTLPGWLQWWAKNQPFSLTVNAVRGWLTGYPEVGNDGWLAAVWLVGFIAVFLPLALWAYEKRTTS